jgi:acyl-coenzyme A thioesterase PaaI-like protein
MYTGGDQWTAPVAGSDRPGSVLGELGLIPEAVGEEYHATAEVRPTMWVPGTETLRPSILAAWADVLLGFLAVRVIAPRVPVTLELDVHTFADIVGCPTVCSVARMTKAGRSTVMVAIEFADAGGTPLGIGNGIFMTQPDARLRIPTGDWALESFSARRGPLTEPFAARAGCQRRAPGVAALHETDGVRNSSDTFNGGLLALVIEEAVLSADPQAGPPSSLLLRYLRPVRGGPAVATADVHLGLATVEVRDESTGALSVLATTRSTGR